MTPSATTPKDPVEGWEAVRDEWVEAVERFVADAESWAAAQGWGTLREPKALEEEEIGAYTVPRLLVHATFGRFVFDPACRFVGGAAGLIDLMALPSWDDHAIVRSGDGRWFFRPPGGGPTPRVWDERLFAETIRRLGSAG